MMSELHVPAALPLNLLVLPLDWYVHQNRQQAVGERFAHTLSGILWEHGRKGPSLYGMKSDTVSSLLLPYVSTKAVYC
jgi:hypothetical protein